MCSTKKNSGMTLIELVIAIFIVSIMIGAVFFLVKGYKKVSDQALSEIDTEAYVNQFLQTIAEEIAVSGYQPVDTTLPSIYLNGKVLNLTFSTGNQLNQMTIISDLNQSARQIITYKLMPLKRSGAHALEQALFKTKQLSDGVNIEDVFVDELALAGISSFSCTESLITAPLYVNAATRGIDCILVVYGSKDFNNLKTYQFYANTENQF